MIVACEYKVREENQEACTPNCEAFKSLLLIFTNRIIAVFVANKYIK